jgi:hypothetical protein
MRNYIKRPWSTEERHFLRDHYHLLPMDELVSVLVGRSPNAIRKQVAYLSSRGWYFKRKTDV